MEAMEPHLNAASDPELAAIVQTAGAEPTGPGLLVVCCMLALMLHTAVIGFGFLLHFFDCANRSETPTPSAGSYLQAFLREWWYGLGIALIYPAGWLPGPFRRRFDANGGPPIALVHGFLMNKTCMFALYWRLRRLGYRNVYTINLHPMFGDLAGIGERLAVDLREISKLCGGMPVHSVGHSMGGLALRWAAHQYDDLPLAQIVSIGTPHHGTRIAVLGFAENLVQMRRGSDFLDALPATTRVPLSCIYTETDNIIIPSDSSAFTDNAIKMTHVGHLSILFNADIMRHLAPHLPPVSAAPASNVPVPLADEEVTL